MFLCFLSRRAIESELGRWKAEYVGSNDSCSASRNRHRQRRKQGKDDVRVVFDLAVDVQPRSFLMPAAGKQPARLVVELADG